MKKTLFIVAICIIAIATIFYLFNQSSLFTMQPSQVTLKTTLGPITIKLDREKAPNTVANFIQYCQDGHYNGTIFHRVINNFMIQGGGMDSDMQERETRLPIDNEAKNGLKNSQGTIAMARTQDPHSATAQFFINVADNDFLNYTAETVSGWGYAVFGAVTAGMDVVNQIKAVKTGNSGYHSDVPVTAIVIESCTIE